MELITPADAAGRVTDALKGAAQATGAGFDYLVRTAKRESALNPSAQNPSSSAQGLFQFIDSTWLEVLKEEGAKLGMADAAASVTKTSSGRYTVQDPARRAELLAMRRDPQAAALIAGAFTQRNADSLTSALGRAPTEGELYAAHFLGAQGAAQLVGLASTTPDASAASAFPAQASANRAIFYDKGRPRSASEVYDKLTAVSGAPVSVPSLAANAPAATTVAIARAAAAEPVEPIYNNGVESDQTAFHSLFKTGRRSPVASYVAHAWSAFGEAGLAADVSGGAKARATSEPIAQAYAPQIAPAERSKLVAAAPRAQAALDAVNSAAAARPAGKTAAAVPVPVGRTPTPVETVAAAPAIASQAASAGLVGLFKTVFSTPAAPSFLTARASRP